MVPEKKKGSARDSAENVLVYVRVWNEVGCLILRNIPRPDAELVQNYGRDCC